MMQRQLFRRLNESRDQGFTIMEIVIALFVLSFGLFGILAMFPVGLRSTRNNVDKTNSSLLSESVVAYLQLAPELTGANSRFPTLDSNVPNDVLISNAIRSGICSMETVNTLVCDDSDGNDQTWDKVNDGAGGTKTVDWTNHALLLLSGRYKGKVFRITGNDKDSLTVATPPNVTKVFDINDDNKGSYFITDGTSFTILGTLNDPPQTSDNVIPTDFFTAEPTMPGMHTETGGNSPVTAFMKIYSLEEYPEKSGEYPLNYKTEDSTNTDIFENQSEYTWACILSDPDAVNSTTVRVDILIYRNYNTALRPDDPSQKPPVDVITTFLTDLQ